MSRLGLTLFLFVVGPALAADPPSTAAPKVGVVSVIERESKAQQGDKARVLAVRDAVFRNDRLTTSTDKETLLHLRLLDDTVLTLGPSSEMVLDDFAINTDAGTAEVQVNLARGLLRFVGGRHAGAGVRYRVKTPVATIGVRGTSFNLLVQDDGTTIAQLEEGEMVMENESGDEVVIDDPNESSLIDESGSAPSEPEINDELTDEFDSLDLSPEQQAADEAISDELDEEPIEVIEDEDPDTDAGDIPETGDDSDEDSSDEDDF